MSKEECMEGCESKTCKFMGAGTSKTVTNSKKYPKKTNVDGKVKATIKTTINGKEDIQSFEGTDAEVQAKIDAAVIISCKQKNALQFARHFLFYILFNFSPFPSEVQKLREELKQPMQLCIDSIENVS
jgi:hypothetical protein